MTRVLGTLATLTPLATTANAAECTTRKSGSITITTCSSSKHSSFSQCRSYRSGSVIKTHLPVKPDQSMIYMLLVIIAAVMYARHGLALPGNLLAFWFVVGIGVYFVGRGWFWLCRRHQLVGWFLFGFLRGLLGGRR